MSSIKSIIKKKVTGSLHNIAVEDDESYVANDILVHNCRSLLTTILIDERDDPDSPYYNYEANWNQNVPSEALNPAKGFGV